MCLPQGTFHAFRRHAPAGPDMGPARTPSHPAALTSCIRGPPAPTPQCRTQLARTQLPCERRRDGCPGPGFTPGQPAARCGPDLGRGLRRRPTRASARGSPHRHSTAPRDAGVNSRKAARQMQGRFLGIWIFFFLGGWGPSRPASEVRRLSEAVEASSLTATASQSRRTTCSTIEKRRNKTPILLSRQPARSAGAPFPP